MASLNEYSQSAHSMTSKKVLMPLKHYFHYTAITISAAISRNENILNPMQYLPSLLSHIISKIQITLNNRKFKQMLLNFNKHPVFPLSTDKPQSQFLILINL